MVTAVAEDRQVVGNLLALEHVNIAVPDQALAMRFYVDGLGFVDDPNSSSGTSTVWLDLGFTQFHLPRGDAQVVRGHVGIVIPDREALIERLHVVAADLADTRFSFGEGDGFVDVTSPWGNWLRCFSPEAASGVPSGIAYVEFEVPNGAAAGIASFYAELLGAVTEVANDDGATIARCGVGSAQELIFREVDEALPAYDGHHVQIYLEDIEGPRQALSEFGLVYEHNSTTQYRFKDLVDPTTSTVLFTVEHEIRSTAHPLFARLLEKRSIS